MPVCLKAHCYTIYSVNTTAVIKNPIRAYCKDRGPVLLEINQSSVDKLLINRKDENLEDLLSYINQLDSKNLPAVLSPEHLCELIDINSETLGAMCHSQESFYSTFYIPKRSGGLRKIDAPLPTMYLAQSFILENIIKNLKYCIESSTAYCKGCSIKDHVLKHTNKEFLLKIDLKNFFPSISIKTVYKLLYEAGFQSDMCSIFANLLTLQGTLPQGAPSSPVLSNVIAFEMDNKIQEYCKSHNLTYTRYADDLAISGSSIRIENQKELEEIIVEAGFEVNKKKLKLYEPDNPVRHLTGLVINKSEIRIPKNTRRKVRQLFFYVEKYLFKDIGLATDNDQINSPFVLKDPIVLERLVGYLNFWLWIEPESIYAAKTLGEINRIKVNLSEFAI